MRTAETTTMRMGEELVLRSFKEKAVTILGPQVLHDLEARVSLPDYVDRTLVSLATRIYGKNGRECRKRIVATYPATWWDALKRDLKRRKGSSRIVAWWLNRHPIRLDARCVTLDFSERMIFPDNETVFPPSLGDPVFLQGVGVNHEAFA